MAFEFDPEAVAAASDVEYGPVAPFNMAGLADAATLRAPGGAPGSTAIANAELRRTFFDALLDLHKLLEEYRFHVGLAHGLEVDYSVKARRGDAPVIQNNPDIDRLGGIPDEARALLVAFMREPPLATELFRDPHQEMTGLRILSRWAAGQMIDSALIRGVAACDRLATLLWARAERPLPRTRAGLARLPTFTPRQLAELDDAYDQRAEWGELTGIAASEFYETVRRLRNGFTHERRTYSELHGERIVSSSGGPTYEGIDAGLHLAFGPAFAAEVLRPAVEHTGRLLAIPE